MNQFIIPLTGQKCKDFFLFEQKMFGNKNKPLLWATVFAITVDFDSFFTFYPSNSMFFSNNLINLYNRFLRFLVV